MAVGARTPGLARGEAAASFAMEFCPANKRTPAIPKPPPRQRHDLGPRKHVVLIGGGIRQRLLGTPTAGRASVSTEILAAAGH